MNKFDVEVSFNLTGKNQFGTEDTLGASRVHTIECETEEEAKELAKAKEPNIDIIKFSVCKY